MWKHRPAPGCCCYNNNNNADTYLLFSKISHGYDINSVTYTPPTRVIVNLILIEFFEVTFKWVQRLLQIWSHDNAGKSSHDLIGFDFTILLYKGKKYFFLHWKNPISVYKPWSLHCYVLSNNDHCFPYINAALTKCDHNFEYCVCAWFFMLFHMVWLVFLRVVS